MMIMIHPIKMISRWPGPHYSSAFALFPLKGKLSTLAPRLVSFHRHSRAIPIVPAFSNDAGMTGWDKNDRDGNWSDLSGGSPHPVILGPVQSFQDHPCHSDGMRTKVIPNHSIWEWPQNEKYLILRSFLPGMSFEWLIFRKFHRP